MWHFIRKVHKYCEYVCIESMEMSFVRDCEQTIYSWSEFVCE